MLSIPAVITLAVLAAAIACFIGGWLAPEFGLRPLQWCNSPGTPTPA